MAYHLKLVWVMALCLSLSLLATVWTGLELYRTTRYNQALEKQAHDTGVAITDLTLPQARYAEAARLMRAGRSSDAIAAYAKLAAGDDAALSIAAHFNQGNHYLRQSISLLDNEGLAAYDRAAPQLSMAKAHYRQALRVKPDWVEAKYNLELALLLSPALQSAPDSEEEEEDDSKATHGWPSIPGFPRGMP